MFEIIVFCDSKQEAVDFLNQECVNAQRKIVNKVCIWLPNYHLEKIEGFWLGFRSFHCYISTNFPKIIWWRGKTEKNRFGLFFLESELIKSKVENKNIRNEVGRLVNYIEAAMNISIR